MNDARVDIDPHNVGRDLASLVLTVVELLRQLMERQAVRRFDSGELTEEQEESVGTTLMLLDERMTQLCELHGLRREDLNLDLGPSALFSPTKLGDLSLRGIPQGDPGSELPRDRNLRQPEKPYPSRATLCLSRRRRGRRRSDRVRGGVGCRARADGG